MEERRRGRGNSEAENKFLRHRKGEWNFHLPVGKEELEQSGADRAECAAVVDDRVGSVVACNDTGSGVAGRGCVVMMQPVVKKAGQQERRTQEKSASAHQNFLAKPVHCWQLPTF